MNITYDELIKGQGDPEEEDRTYYNLRAIKYWVNKYGQEGLRDIACSEMVGSDLLA